LPQRYFYNNKIIEIDSDIKNFIKKNFGLGWKLLPIINQRIEECMFIMIKEFNKNQWENFLDIIYSVVPYNTNLRSKFKLSILLLDLNTSYRGWRHSKGLPVRGQRTWSNAWSVYKSNNILRNYRLRQARKYFMNVPVREGNVAYAAEYVNLLWRRQWPFEWYAARNNRLGFKGHPSTMKIDLYSMANYQIMHPYKLQNLSKKQKQSYKRNYFSLGFDTGFTKALMNAMFNSSIAESFDSDLKGTKVILRDERLNRKKKN